MMDGGRTCVFDANGAEVEMDWPAARVDLVRPIGWFYRPTGEPLLACMAADEGDDNPRMYLAALHSGKVEAGAINEVLGHIGRELFIGFSNMWW
jgi:hypothetical protein